MYGVEEIQKITGYKTAKCYQIIRTLQEKMKKEDPNVLIIGSRIPISIFEKYVLGKKEEVN